MERKEKIITGPPPLKIPNISLGQYIIDHLRKNANRVILREVTTDYATTNRDILEKSVKLAHVLSKRGVKLGDRIAIISENHRNWLVAACSTLYLGGVVVPYNPTYTEWEIKPLLPIARPKIIFVSHLTESLYVYIVTTLSWPVELIELDDKALHEHVPTLKGLLEGHIEQVDPDRYIPISIDDNSKQEAVILCSSGTTGTPKGVTLSHRNLLLFVTVVPTQQCLGFQPDDKVLVFLPFYHGYAFGLLLMSIAVGTTAFVMPSFNRETFLESIAKYGITHLPIVPPIFVFLAKHPMVTEYDTRSVREVICGAAPLPKELVDDVKKRLNIQAIRNAYGMTELSIIICMSDRSGNNVDGCYLLPGVLVKIIDLKTHESLDADQIGEICVKGDYVMLGYCSNRKATEETIDKDGWLHTGDIGYYDKRSRLYLIDRLKELIKYKAYQVSPVELEIILQTHPAVKEAAVVGKPDELSGELPMALVVKQPGVNISPQEIVRFVDEKVSPPKRLRGGVRFVEAIPKNPTGKILRREIRKMISNL